MNEAKSHEVNTYRSYHRIIIHCLHGQHKQDLLVTVPHTPFLDFGKSTVFSLI
jgi:hypothetical protein